MNKRMIIYVYMFICLGQGCKPILNRKISIYFRNSEPKPEPYQMLLENGLIQA